MGMGSHVLAHRDRAGTRKERAMTRRILLAWSLVPLMGLSAQAQNPYSRTLVPSRTALGRLGLERHWFASVPLQAGTERVLSINLAGRGMNERQPGSVYHAPATASGFISNSNLSEN